MASLSTNSVSLGRSLMLPVLRGRVLGLSPLDAGVDQHLELRQVLLKRAAIKTQNSMYIAHVSAW